MYRACAISSIISTIRDEERVLKKVEVFCGTLGSLPSFLLTSKNR